ncbi:MAG: hypothetical protein ACO1O6_10480 [Bacteroidota bacterium]
MNRKNMRRTASFFLSIHLLFLAGSCRSASYSGYAHYTELNPVSCDGKAHNIFLFFEGETVNFEYRKLGLVRVNFYNEEIAYKLMKQEAYNRCGNVLLQVKRVTEKDVYTDVNGKVNTRNTTYYTGIVAQIDESSGFWEKHKTEVDTSFLAYQPAEGQKRHPAGGGRLIMTVGVMAIVGMLVVGLSGHP